jgi:hypothetical protein
VPAVPPITDVGPVTTGAPAAPPPETTARAVAASRLEDVR